MAERQRRDQVRRGNRAAVPTSQIANALDGRAERFGAAENGEVPDGQRVDDVGGESADLAVPLAKRHRVEADGIRRGERAHDLHPPEVDAGISDVGELPVDDLERSLTVDHDVARLELA